MSSRNNPARVAIVMGSKSDWATMQFADEIFEILDVPHHVEVVSAHRTPDKLFSFAETAEGLLINELAPRVHNSGHWTQNGASISQFELHLRAITGLPLPAPVINAPSVMINLIGSELNYDWLKLPLVHLHWYDKAVRPGRKVGHLNLTDSDTSRLSATLEALSPLLPGEYASGIIWAQSKLK